MIESGNYINIQMFGLIFWVVLKHFPYQKDPQIIEQFIGIGSEEVDLKKL